MPSSQRPPETGLVRTQRALAAMATSVIGLTVIAIATLLVCRAVGVPQQEFGHGVLQFAAVFPTPGLAIGLLLAIALIVVSIVQRSRAAR